MNNFEKIKNNQKENFEYFVNKINSDELSKLVNLIYSHKDNNIYFTGVGKSNNVALHLVDLFKSIGLKTFHLNLLNLTHGDYGSIKENDLIFFISKSGNTEEIFKIIKIVNCYKVLICCNHFSKIKTEVDETYIVPFNQECDINFKLIPSNSITNTINYFNYILNLYIVKINLSIEKYKNYHPSGDIGFRTKKIIDFVNKNIYICNDININFNQLINLLNDNKSGIIFEDNDKFYGIITNKDIVKLHSYQDKIGEIMNGNIKKYINKNPIIIENSNEFIKNKIDFIRKYKFFKFIPVIDNEKCIGIIDNSKILKYL
jgi:arabinose-5-phosphate isomerase